MGDDADFGIVFVNRFTVHGSPVEFERAFLETAGFLRDFPGHVRHSLLRDAAGGERYINIAHWRDEQSLRAAVGHADFRAHAAALRALSTRAHELYRPL